MRRNVFWAPILTVLACAAFSALATVASAASSRGLAHASVMHLGSSLSGPQAVNLGTTSVGAGYLRQQWAVDGQTLTVVGPAGTTVSLGQVVKDAQGRSSLAMGILAPPITPSVTAMARSGALGRAGISPNSVARLTGIQPTGRMLKRLNLATAAYNKGDTMHIICASWGSYPTSFQNCDTSYFIQYGQGPCCEVGDAESAFGQNWQGQKKVDQLQVEGWWNYGDAHTFTERPTVVYNIGPCSNSTFTITLLAFSFGFGSSTCSGQMYPMSKYSGSNLIGWGAGYKNTNDTQNGSEGLSPTYGSTVGWSEQEYAWAWMEWR